MASMWQDTRRKVISEIRRPGMFRSLGVVSWTVLAVFLSLAGLLTLMFLATRRS
jgi:hypothetical protein